MPIMNESSTHDYFYKQYDSPMNAVGVEVTLDVIDANGNLRNIDSATSDASGFYSVDWIPDIEGKYTIIATFQGSKSYWPSYAETAFVVDEAHPTPTQQPIAALPPTEMYILGATVAIITAIAILGLLLLRKRP
jgi:hypothetical protein